MKTKLFFGVEIDEEKHYVSRTGLNDSKMLFGTRKKGNFLVLCL
jgi:hypothetical protein